MMIVMMMMMMMMMGNFHRPRVLLCTGTQSQTPLAL